MTNSPTTQASLLLRLGDARDGAAWGQFVELYAPPVYACARRQGLQDADAADLTQDVLRAGSGAFRRGDYAAARGRFGAGLFAGARNKLRDSLAGGARHVRGSGDTATHARLEAEPVPDADPAQLWEQECER